MVSVLSTYTRCLISATQSIGCTFRYRIACTCGIFHMALYSLLRISINFVLFFRTGYIIAYLPSPVNRFLKVFSKYGSPWQAPTADFSIRSRMFYATELTDYMERMMIVEITPQVWKTRILPLNYTRINYLPACQPRFTER